MGFLDRLFGHSAPSEGGHVPRGHRVVLDGPGTFSLPIVGESHYQEAIESICGPRTDEGEDRLVEAYLVLDDGNSYDSQAVRVDIAGMTVGYLSRENARQYRAELAKTGYRNTNAYCRARIRGGWDRGERGRGHYGIYLDLHISD
jgi:hypothetical protein